MSSPTTTRFRFWAVVSSTAGVFIALSVRFLARQVPTNDMVSDFGQLQLLALEAAMGAFWIPRLVRDGWTSSCVTRPFAGRDLLRGAGLYLYALIVYWTTWVAAGRVVPDLVRWAVHVHIGGSVSWWSAALVSTINPVAEEFLYLGFVANVLRPRSFILALATSVFLRTAVHLYQGPLAILSIAPTGIVWTLYYLHTRRIWPPVVAHAILDAYALGRLATAAA